MGCDIHGFVQTRWAPASAYSDACPVEDTRSYRVFTMLAGVRDYGEGINPIAPPRGLPGDFEMDDTDHGGVWMGDHSYSWLTLTEIRGWAGWDEPVTIREWVTPFREQVPVFSAWLAYLDLKYGWLLKDDPAAVRLVFGFDN